MNTVSVNIDRLAVTLHGVSALVAEESVRDLKEELRRRLGVLVVSDQASADIGELAIGPIHSEMVLDPAALRAIIAERLVLAIRAACAGEPTFGRGAK